MVTNRSPDVTDLKPTKKAKYISIADMAALLGVSQNTIRRLVALTDIPHVDLTRPGCRRKRLLRFDADEVIAWAEGRAAVLDVVRKTR